MANPSDLSGKPIKLIIVEDDQQIQELLRILLNGTPGFYCQAVFSTATEFLAALPDLQPDMVLMDIDLGDDLNGIEAVRRLRHLRADIPVVMLTVHEDSEAVFAALCAGAVGYLIKGIAPTELLAALRDAATGGAPMSPRIARRVVETFHVGTQNPLSSREKEVLTLLCAGDSYKSIADQLFISGHTVRSHIKNIYEKLHVHSRAEAVVKAMKDRLI
jgi:DNA-binding NarL/FixJ family response regulator